MAQKRMRKVWASVRLAGRQRFSFSLSRQHTQLLKKRLQEIQAVSDCREWLQQHCPGRERANVPGDHPAGEGACAGHIWAEGWCERWPLCAGRESGRGENAAGAWRELF